MMHMTHRTMFKGFVDHIVVDGELKSYLDKDFTVPLCDIERATLAKERYNWLFGRREVLILHLKDGSEKRLWTGLQHYSSQEVIRRLSEAFEAQGLRLKVV